MSSKPYYRIAERQHPKGSTMTGRGKRSLEDKEPLVEQILEKQRPEDCPDRGDKIRSSGFLKLDFGFHAFNIAVSCPDSETVRTPAALFGAPSSPYTSTRRPMWRFPFSR